MKKQLKQLAQELRKKADAASKRGDEFKLINDHVAEGVELGKQIAYDNAALELEKILEQGGEHA